MQSRRLGPSKAVPLEGPEGVRVVRLPLSGETILAERKKESETDTVNRGDSTQIRVQTKVCSWDITKKCAAVLVLL